MATRPNTGADGLDDPATLLALIDELATPTFVGFETTSDHVALHLAPLPPDHRAGSAGLFGTRAARRWSAVGVAVVGSARHLDTRELISAEACARVVVDRDGRVASTMSIDGRRVGDDPPDPSDPAARCSPMGLMVDALHRMLGRPSPGSPPPPWAVTLAVWAQSVVEVALDVGRITWTEALELHPGAPGRGCVDPSVETVVEATMRAAENFDWVRVHRRASRGRGATGGLSTAEVAWMDPTMFSRWVLGSLPDPRAVVDLVESQGSARVADGMRTVIDALESQ